jgi:hypothetical protein
MRLLGRLLGHNCTMHMHDHRMMELVQLVARRSSMPEKAMGGEMGQGQVPASQLRATAQGLINRVRRFRGVKGSRVTDDDAM